MSGKSTALPRKLTSYGVVTGLNGPSRVVGIFAADEEDDDERENKNRRENEKTVDAIVVEFCWFDHEKQFIKLLMFVFTFLENGSDDDRRGSLLQLFFFYYYENEIN